jgi:hypothetical protein
VPLNTIKPISHKSNKATGTIEMASEGSLACLSVLLFWNIYNLFYNLRNWMQRYEKNGYLPNYKRVGEMLICGVFRKSVFFEGQKYGKSVFFVW